VKTSSPAALGLALTLLLTGPRSALAQEAGQGAASTDGNGAPVLVMPAIVGAEGVVRPLGARLARFGLEPAGARSTLFAPTPAEVRLSHGAKTALIVTAIVVGALVVVGLVAVTRPGHL